MRLAFVGALHVALATTLLAVEPQLVDLSPAANRALADQVANDGAGGWTDQGPERDLSGLATGPVKFGQVPMRLDPGPRACVVLGPSARQVPATATVPLPAGEHRHLYLLHALAWAGGANEPGCIVALDAKGGELATITIKAGQDVADWWSGTDLPNGRMALRTAIDMHEVGLFLSHFDLPAGTRALRLAATEKAVWGVVAATVAEREVAMPTAPKAAPAAVAGAEWHAMTIRKEVEPGSAADLSFLLDAPAGKHGAVRIGADGHLQFADGTPARFAGGNFSLLSQDLLTAHPMERMPELAQRWAALGNNVIRWLYIDRYALQDTPEALRLREPQMAHLDRLAAELKARGVYLTIDLLWSRTPNHAIATVCPEIFAKYKANSRELKTFYVAALNFIPGLRDDWEQAARLILEHVNPHTGLAWKDDPQLIHIGLSNEDNLDHHYKDLPELKELSRTLFIAWLRKRYHDDAGLAKAWGPLRPGESLEQGTIELPGAVVSGPRELALFDFLSEAQTTAWQDMAARLRKIGCKQVLTGSNYVSNPFSVAIRRPHDAVDNHAYWDHPRFGKNAWGMPYGHNGTPMMTAKRGWRVNPATSMAISRHWGKPMLVTEYDHVYPNPGRSDAGLVAGAMAALQGWDLFTSFNYSYRADDLFDPQPIRGFDKVGDPLGKTVELQQRLLFLRGDVRPALGRVTLAMDPERLAEGKVGEEGLLLSCITGVGIGFTTGQGPSLGVTPGTTGSIPANTAGKDGMAAWLTGLKGTVLPKTNASDVSAQRLVSDTGELTWDHGTGRLLVDTPMTQGATLATPGAVQLAKLTAQVDTAPSTISVSSLDRQPLATCGRALAIFVTDVVNSDLMTTPGRLRMDDVGKLPLLVRSGSATVTVANPRLRRAWALDTAGARIAEIPVERDGDRLRLSLATVRNGQATLMAELGE